jgi:hypothetical protein
MECVILENQTQSWIPTSKEDTFNNQLIEAYMNGKKEGMEQHQKLIFKKLEENIEKSGFITFELINMLKGRRFNPIDAYLRVNSWDKFDIMITVSEEDYLKEEFFFLFDVVSNVEKRYKVELFGIFISFCSINKHFDEQSVSSDGYSLKLEKI